MKIQQLWDEQKDGYEMMTKCDNFIETICGDKETDDYCEWRINSLETIEVNFKEYFTSEFGVWNIENTPFENIDFGDCDNIGQGFYNIYQLVMGNEIGCPFDGNAVLKIENSKNGKIKIMKQNVVGNNLRRELEPLELQDCLDLWVSENDLLHILFF